MLKSKKIESQRAFLQSLLDRGAIDKASFDAEIASLQTVKPSTEWDQGKIERFGIKPKGKGRLSYKGCEVLDLDPSERPEMCIFECYDSEQLIVRVATDRLLRGEYREIEGEWVCISLIGLFDRWPYIPGTPDGQKGDRFGALYQTQLAEKNRIKSDKPLIPATLAGGAQIVLTANGAKIKPPVDATAQTKSKKGKK